MKLDAVVVQFVKYKTQRNHSPLSPYIQHTRHPIILSASLKLIKPGNPLNAMVIANPSTDSKQVKAERHYLSESSTCRIP